MRPLYCALSVAALLALAGCATNDSAGYSQGPTLGMTPSSTDDTSMTGDTTVANTPPPTTPVGRNDTPAPNKS